MPSWTGTVLSRLWGGVGRGDDCPVIRRTDHGRRMIRTVPARVIIHVFASSSVAVHLLRGLLGLVALVSAAVGAVLVTPAALGLLVVTVVAWRGCPTCWTVGLLQTVANGQACRRPGERRQPTGTRARAST